MAGQRIEGDAAQFVTEMLPRYVSEEQLGKVGIHREMRTRARQRPGPLVTETRFVRAHREVDVTSYDDAIPQTMILSPGLDARVSGAPREVDLFALLLIHESMLMRLASEQAAYRAQAKRFATEHKAKQERERALLAMWDKLGKKRRANLVASDPEVAALCARLDEEREYEARMDALDRGWA